MKPNDLITQRLLLVRQKLDEWKVDAILIGSSKNRRWLTGFNGSAGWVLISQHLALLGTDFRYWEQAVAQSPVFELVKFTEGFQKELKRLLDHIKLERVGIEANHLTLQEFDQLTNVENKTFVQMVDCIEILRQYKAPEEIECITHAAHITDQVMSDLKTWLRPGMSEKEVAWKLEVNIHDAGATGLAFPVIVASGPNAARAHHEPGNRELIAGDPVIVDMGAENGGYCSDLTRTFFLGQTASDSFLNVFDLVLNAQQNAIKNMNGQLSPQEIDGLARDIIESHGFGDEFGHGLGHGLGLDIHEQPLLSRNGSTKPIGINLVLTIEPAIYIPGWGGVRIEDLVWLREGSVDLLSRCPKGPFISC